MLALCASATPAAVFDRDDRVTDRSTRELLSIGVVTGGHRIAYATGFLIGDCEALTVKHAAGRIATALGRRMRFTQVGVGAQSSRATVIAEGSLDLVRDWVLADRDGDWLLLRLDRCLGRESGHASLSSTPLSKTQYWKPDGPGLQSAGFPIDRRRRDGITRDPHCRVRMARQGQLFNDCAALPGNSGSPLFAIEATRGQRQLIVFAMQSTATAPETAEQYSQGRASVAVSVADIIPVVAPLLTMTVTGKRPPRAR